MDQTKDEYIQLLTNARAQLEFQVMTLQKELRDVREAQKAQEAQSQETDGVLMAKTSNDGVLDNGS